MEAAAFGRPIVTTDVDGIPELVGPEEAWLVPPADANALADAMQSALEAHLRGDLAPAERVRAHITALSDTKGRLPEHEELIRIVTAPRSA